MEALTRRTYRNRLPEAVLFGLHLAAYPTAMLLVLSPVKALAFV